MDLVRGHLVIAKGEAVKGESTPDGYRWEFHNNSSRAVRFRLGTAIVLGEDRWVLSMKDGEPAFLYDGKEP